MKREILTKEICHNIAKTCSSREQFKQTNLHAYNLAKRAGWLTKWFPILRNLSKSDCESVAKLCSTRSELNRIDPAVYQKCRKAGWLDEFIPNKPRTLTFAMCQEIASNYSSRSELKLGDCAVYETSRKHGWLNKFYNERQYAGRHLTKELCKTIASYCSSRSDFCEKDASAYWKSLANGWLQEFFPTRKVKCPYTYEECNKIALSCSTKAEFKRTNATAYQVSRKKGWLNTFTHFKDSHTAHSEAMQKYTDADIIAEAKKYSTLTEFRKFSSAAYQCAYRRNLIHTFTWFDAPVGKSSDVIYVYEFQQFHYAYIGRTVYPAKRDAQHHIPGDSVYEFAKQHGVKIPSPKYVKQGLNPFTEGASAEREIIKQYKANGWNVINKTSGGELGNMCSMKYSKKQCFAAAKKYIYKIDFLRAEPNIYKFAKSHGYLDSYTWLKSTITPASHWTYENCRQEASKYETRREFCACSRSAYIAARQHGWLNEFFPAK